MEFYGGVRFAFTIRRTPTSESQRTVVRKLVCKELSPDIKIHGADEQLLKVIQEAPKKACLPFASAYRAVIFSLLLMQMGF